MGRVPDQEPEMTFEDEVVGRLRTGEVERPYSPMPRAEFVRMLLETHKRVPYGILKITGTE